MGATKTSLKILMIEDDSRDAELIGEMLSEQHEICVELKTVGRLSEAMQSLTKDIPDVVLLDLSLPDGKGIELIDKLGSYQASLPIIVLTGNEDEQLAISAVRRGAQDYLVKGKASGDALLRSIRYAVERQQLLMDILEQKKYGEQITAALKEKDVLLKEVHHRVKNNLQIISSLLKLHTGSLKDDRDTEVFKDCQNKIKSMALIHEILYQSENLAKINFADYLRKLTLELFRSSGIRPDAIALQIKADDVLLGVDVAIPCGLIVNELVSNSIKHAFPGRKDGKIQIDFTSDASGKVTMTIMDNGVGMSREIDIHKTESLGLRLVSTLTEQLGGHLEWKSAPGTQFKVAFPVSSI